MLCHQVNSACCPGQLYSSRAHKHARGELYLVNDHVYQVDDAKEDTKQTRKKESHDALHTDICIIHV